MRGTICGFNPDEQAEIVERLDEIKEYVKNTHSLSQEQMVAPGTCQVRRERRASRSPAPVYGDTPDRRTDQGLGASRSRLTLAWLRLARLRN
jgi:hypothetical protein